MEKNSSKRTSVYLIITIFGMVIFPLVLLAASNRFQYVNFEYAIPTTFTQIFAIPMVKNLAVHLSLVFSMMAIVVFSTTFLFEIRMKQSTIEAIEYKWYWRYILRRLIIHKKHTWHILIGYFIAIMALNPILGKGFLEVQSQLQPITLYQAYVSTVVITSVVLLLARLLSKLDLQIIDTNIGVFIILIYIAEMIFATISFLAIPLETLVNFVYYSPANAEGMFMLYGSEMIGAILITFVDWLIVVKWWKKEL